MSPSPFARKLHYKVQWTSPTLRGSLQETCALFKLKTPYSLIRDVATRWNSTLDMVERALVLWDAITTWQEHNAKLIPAKYRVKRSYKSSYQPQL
ncbi:hypothetical protein CF319_g7115 [Tilletia indica]|nr:hypothetical protein CF319_g7115 [Tilletia indica]